MTKRDAKHDLKCCELAKISNNLDDGVRYAEMAKYWINRAIEAEELLRRSSDRIPDYDGDFLDEIDCFLRGDE